MIELDPIDRRILHRLQERADCSLEELGEEVGLSRNACWRRVKLMEERGVLRARVALIDPEVIGLSLTVFILIRTDRHDSAWLDQFAKATRSLPEITGVWRMTGDLDYMVRAEVSDVAAYDILYRRLIERVEIADVSASFVMERVKETTALPVL